MAFQAETITVVEECGADIEKIAKALRARIPSPVSDWGTP
jgi:hypothetical protein